jgi:HSP20 family molecular chaperone IbpA
MSLIPHAVFPRSMMDMEKWTKPMMDQWANSVMPANMTPEAINEMWKKSLSTLDMFDPFDALDHTIGRNMQWLNRPEFLLPTMPKVPQKYRITLDCAGYTPKSIKTEWNGKCLTVTGIENIKCEGSDDFSLKEFKKTYVVPETAECDKMVSFLTAEGQLVIEVPLKETEKHMNMDLFPQIVDDINGGKKMTMKFTVPENIKPEHIHISIKDRCLVVKAEEKKIKPDGVSTFHYYKRTTLPENTDFEALKCNYDNHKISVNAPLNLDWTPTKKITLEGKGYPVDKNAAFTPATWHTHTNKCIN